MESLGHSIVQTCKALDLDVSNYIQGNDFELSSFLEDVSASSSLMDNKHNQQMIQELVESFNAKYQGE